MKSFIFSSSRLRYFFTVFLFSLLFSTHAWSQFEARCTEVCNWYSTTFALCQNQDAGWGWENSEVCISRPVCEVQWGDGGVVEQCKEEEDKFCTTEYAPVCSVVATETTCTEGTCQIGEYLTFSNLCNSMASNAEFIQQGECGDLEGEAYCDTSDGTCPEPPAPVCTVSTAPEPCHNSPCPISTYKTFDSAESANRTPFTRIVRNESCSDEEEGHRVIGLGQDVLCPAVYMPVCAKKQLDVTCAGLDCPTHNYETYSNGCSAGVAGAEVIWTHQGCGALEDEVAVSYPPVKMVSALNTDRFTPRVDKARVENDVLYVNLFYSGCNEQHFDFQVSQTFAESMPVQASWTFVAQVDQACQEAFNVEYQYDLKPLKAIYQEQYGAGSGTIVLPGLIDYSFE